MPQIKDSLYEQLNPLTTVAGQHLVEDFSGDTLDTFRWGTRITESGAGVTVAGVIEMSDSVNGGLFMKVADDINNYCQIAFCDSANPASSNQEPMNVRPYNHVGSTCIFRVQFAAASKFGSSALGFDESTSASPNAANDAAILKYTFWNPANKYNLATSDGSTVNTTGTSSATMDTDPHIFKIDCRPTYCSMSIDGVREVSNTTNLPLTKMGLNFGIYSHGTSTDNAEANLSYVEAWNH